MLIVQVQTSQANTKRYFRKAEFLLREAELLCTIASLHTGFAYPKEVRFRSTGL